MSIAKSLHNNHNVYIIGAGFSRLRGLPLMYDFMSRMRDALDYHAKQGHVAEVDAIERVLEFRLKAAGAAYRVQLDLENIEELFSLASASLGQLEDSMKLAIAATLDFAANARTDPVANYRCEGGVLLQPNWQNVPGELGKFQSNSAPAYEFIVRALLGRWNEEPVGENTFITFNYDNLLENAMKGLNYSFDLGLESRKARLPGATRILKLHGSVNWAVPVGAKTRVESLDSYRRIVENKRLPELIPPTWKKDSKGVFSGIWDESLRSLSDATRIVIIGFSIPQTDLHFKYLLAAGMRDNFSLREIVFVNPSPGLQLVRERCEMLFANKNSNAANVRFIDSTIEQFVGQGTGTERVASIGRPLPPEIQHLSFSNG